MTLLLLAGAAIAETYTGKAIYISDGDTLSVLVDEAESKTVYKSACAILTRQSGISRGAKKLRKL